MNKKVLKVGIISKFPPYLAGPALQAYHISLYLKKKGHKPFPITYSSYKNKGARLKDLDIKTLLDKIYFSSVFEFSKLVSWPIGLVMLNTVIEANNKEKIDVLDSHYAIPHGIVAALGGKILGIPSIMSCKGSDIMHFAQTKEFKEIFRYAANSVEYVIACSKFLAKNIYKLGVSPNKVKVIYECVDTKRFDKTSLHTIQAAKTKLKLDNNFIIGFSGRLEKEKGLDYLLKAFQIFKKEIKNSKLVLLGDGSYKESLLKQIKALGLEKDCILIKARYKDYPVYTKMFDILVLPSITTDRFVETLGISLLDGLASKALCIGSNVGGIPEIIKDGETGLLVKQKDAYDLAKKMIEVAKNPVFYNKIRNQGYAFVKKHFDIEIIGEKILNLYMHVVDKYRVKSYKNKHHEK